MFKVLHIRNGTWAVVLQLVLLAKWRVFESRDYIIQYYVSTLVQILFVLCLQNVFYCVGIFFVKIVEREEF